MGTDALGGVQDFILQSLGGKAGAGFWLVAVLEE
jgi:hypothetical protein